MFNTKNFAKQSSCAVIARSTLCVRRSNPYGCNPHDDEPWIATSNTADFRFTKFSVCSPRNDEYGMSHSSL
jgi:hypothetical protein